MFEGHASAGALLCIIQRPGITWSFAKYSRLVVEVGIGVAYSGKLQQTKGLNLHMLGISGYKRKITDGTCGDH